MSYVTKTGKILTDEDIEGLAAEAEAGYDVSHLVGKPSRRVPPDDFDERYYLHFHDGDGWG